MVFEKGKISGHYSKYQLWLPWRMRQSEGKRGPFRKLYLRNMKFIEKEALTICLYFLIRRLPGLIFKRNSLV